jgi:hypothetical protein
MRYDTPQPPTTPGVCLGGCLPRTIPCGEVEGVPVWPGDEQCPIIPREEYLNQEEVRWPVYDLAYQNGYNSCTATSLRQHCQWSIGRAGLDQVILDDYKLWNHLTNGHNVGLSLQEVVAYIVRYGYPIKGSDQRLFPDEYYEHPAVESALSALQLGHGLWYGRHIGSGGHAESATSMRVIATLPTSVGNRTYLIFRSRKEGKVDSVSINVPGTWGTNYGDNGWYYVSESDLVRGIPTFGAYSFRTWKLGPADVDGCPDVREP